MRALHRSLIAAAATTAVVAAVWAPTALADDAHDDRGAGRQAIGLTYDNGLVRFSTADPGRAERIGAISGLAGDRKLVGIDFRVQDRKLYGVGDAGGLYTVDPGSATVDKFEQLDVALDGRSFGVDFNPAANALRIISDNGQNLRQSFAPVLPLLPTLPNTVTDTPLTNPGGGPAKGVTGAAYTNNDLDAATATTLFDLDTAKDRLSAQNPANAGTLVPVGSLGEDLGPKVGFDIVSTVVNGAATANEAFATAVTGHGSRLLAVDLQSGEASDAGTFRHEVVDLALELG